MASLGEDLARLRKKESLTLQDIYDVTRLPANIIKAIENETIFSDPTKNPTYVRSFVRTYARALKIREDDIVEALDKTDLGKYDGLIKQKYSGLSQGKETAPTEGDEDTEDASYQPRFSLADAEEKAKKEEKSAETDKAEKNKPDSSQTPKPAPKAAESKNKAEDEETNTARPNKRRFPPPPQVENVDWVKMSAKTVDSPSKSHTAIITVVILILAGLLVYFIYSFGGNPFSRHKNPSFATTTDSSTELAQVPVDSVKVAAQVNKPLPVITDTVPDTLHLDIYAAFNKLDPVRVKTDVLDSLNPYWIEQGNAMRFEFVKDIFIRGQFDRMILLLNGHPIQDFTKYKNQDGLVHISRSILENDPKWLTPAPDSLGHGVPFPSRILERPHFY